MELWECLPRETPWSGSLLGKEEMSGVQRRHGPGWRVFWAECIEAGVENCQAR